MANFPTATKVAGSPNIAPDLNEVYANLIAIDGPAVIPSGDTTGAVDSGVITAVLSAYGVARLTQGVFYVNAPISLASSQALIGVGRGTSIQPGSAWSGTNMVQLASSSAAQVTVRDLILSVGFKTSVKGIFFNCTGLTDPNYLIDGVTILDAGSDSFTVTCTTASAGSKISNCVSIGSLGVGYTVGSDVQINNCEAGLSLGHGFVLQTNSITTNCKSWFSGYNAQNANWSTGTATSCGFFTSSNVVTINGCSAQQNGLHGYWLSGTSGVPLEFINMSGNESDTNGAYANANSLTPAGNGIQVDWVLRSSITGTTGANNAGLGVGSQVYGITLTGTWSTAAGLPGNTFISNNSVIGATGVMNMPQGVPTGGGGTGVAASTIYVVNGLMCVNTLGSMTPVTSNTLVSIGSLLDFIGTNDPQVGTTYRMTINGTATQATGTALTLQFNEALTGTSVTFPTSFAGAGTAFTWEMKIELSYAAVGGSGSSLLRVKVVCVANGNVQINFKNNVTTVATTGNWRIQPQAAWGGTAGTPTLQPFNSFMERLGP